MDFRFVSLGGDCQPAVQIGFLTSRQPAGFFDRLGSPISAVISLIETGFSAPMRTDSLEAVMVGDRLERVIDRSTGLQFDHDFPNLEPETIATVQARYRLQARWLMQLFDEEEPPSYFIRRWAAEYDGPEDEREAIRLFEALRARRPDIRLLYLHQDRTRPTRNFGAYRSAYLSRDGGTDWTGDSDEWRELLHNFAMLPGDDQAFPLRPTRRPRFGATPARAAAPASDHLPNGRVQESPHG